MAVTKKNGFRAPYKSTTFQTQANELEGRNGVLKLEGPLVESSGNLTVPALTFVQQGLIVTNDSEVIRTVPTDLTEPFFVAVSSPSSFQQDDLVYKFIKGPFELTAQDVLIGEKSNGVWRAKDLIKKDDVIKMLEQDRLDADRAAPIQGLKTAYNSPLLETAPGIIIDKQGQRFEIGETIEHTPISEDPDWTRVDRLVYRRPLTTYERTSGVFQLLGGTFSTGAQIGTPTNIFGTTVPHSTVKTLALSDNTVVVLTAEGYGTEFVLKYTRYDEDRTTELVSAVSIATDLDNDIFDAVVDNSDNIAIAYTSAGKLMTSLHTGATGTISGSTVEITDGTNPVLSPSLSRLPNGQLAYLYRRSAGAGNYDIYLSVRSAALGAVFGPAEIATGNLSEPNIFADNNSQLHVVYKDVASDKIHYTLLDDSASVLKASEIISDSTTHAVHGTLTGGVSSPKVVASDNEEVVITFLQEKPSTDNGLAIWKDGKANMYDLVDASETINVFDFDINEVFGSLNIILGLANDENHYVKLLGDDPYLKVELSSTDGAVGVSLVTDKKGSLAHAYSKKAASTYTNYGTNDAVANIGAQLVNGTLNNITLDADEMLIVDANKPKVGDRVTISSSGAGNDGAYIVAEVTIVSLNTADDFAVVRMTTAFPGNEAGSGDAQKAAPNGNEAVLVKSVSESADKAYLVEERNTDVLLARVIQPGNVVLNYFSGSGGVVNSDTMGLHGNVVLGWETTTGGQLDITNDLKIVDFVNNLEYTIAEDDLSLSEDDAVYVVFDGSDLTPSYQVAPINQLPLAEPIQVMGFVKSGAFHPHFLLKGDVGTLDSGEEGTVGTDLPSSIRARLGISSDTSYVAYPSTGIISTNDSYPVAIGKLNAEVLGQAAKKNVDRLAKLIGGGTWFWDHANNNLEISADAYIQIPNVNNTANTIEASGGPFTLADGQVARVSLNRTTGTATNLPVTISAMNSFSPNDNTFILARRVGDNVYLSNGVRLQPGERIEMDGILAELNRFLRRLVLQPVPGNAKRLQITVPESSMLDGSKVGQVINNLMLDPLFEAQIDPVTGNVYKGDGTTPIAGAGSNPLFEAPTIAANQFRWFGVSLVPFQVNSNGEMEGSVLVLPASADGASAATATKDGAVLGGDIPIGWFYAQRNAGDTDIEDMTFANIVRVPVSGGSGGGGGDASTALGRLEDLLDDSFYEFLEPNIFSIDKTDKLETGTGSYSFASKTYEMSAGNLLDTHALLDPDFLLGLDDVLKAQVALIFDKGSVDSNPAVEMTPNGNMVDLQTVTMERLSPSSDTYVGELLFDLSALTRISLYEYLDSEADAAVELEDAGNREAVSQEFTTGTDTEVLEELSFYLNKTGAPQGHLKLNIHEDNAGEPGTIVHQSIVGIDPLSTGNITVNKEVGRRVLAPSTKYHLSVETDEDYKNSFDTGVDSVSIRVDNSSPSIADRYEFDGTSWSVVAGSAMTFLVEGRKLDLRMRYTASEDAKVVGYGVYYGEEAQRTERVKRRAAFVFNATTAPQNEFQLPWDADPDFLEVQDRVMGQVWGVPSFELQGNKIVFEEDFFEGRETVYLLAKQVEAGSFDGNPELKKIIAENHLGSNDPSSDYSVPGRGPIVSTETTAIKVELTVDADFNIVIKEA